MLSELHKNIIESNLATILQTPTAITDKEYIETYNAIFSHCTEHTVDYTIKGETIYNMLKEKLCEFTDRLLFDGCVQHMAEQIRKLLCSMDLLEKIFSYLGRFYVRISILNNKDVKKIRDLFYYQAYYHFIYKIEENLITVILMEVETFRKQYKQDFSDLAIVIQFYLNCLSNNGLTTNIANFCRRYIEDFQNNFEFNVDIGKLLKKIYIEMFFATTVISDRDIAKEIIQRILFRKDELVDYAMGKVQRFEKFKHVYAIINKMPENCRSEFKRRYQEFVTLLMNDSHTFADLYLNYSRVIEQIAINKLIAFNEIVNTCVTKSFSERSAQMQTEIHTEMVDFINNYIVNTYYKTDFFDHCNTAAESAYCEDTNLPIEQPSHENAIFQVEVNENDSIEKDEFQVNAARFFSLFALVFDDFLADLYTASTQTRLLKGMNARREQTFTDMICEKVGWSSVSILKKSVLNFQDVHTYDFRVSQDQQFPISSVFLTKTFWEIGKDEPNLHPILSAMKEEMLKFIEVPEHHILEFNYSLSPIIFSHNDTDYKISTSVFSLLLYIMDSNGIELEVLRSKSNDLHFDTNLEILVRNEFVKIEANKDGKSVLNALNKYSSECAIDLFEVPVRKMKSIDFVLPDTHHQYVLEALVCKIMKRLKGASVVALKGQLNCTNDDFERVVSSLISKGYLNMEDDLIKYIP